MVADTGVDEATTKTRIAILMTSFNRREMTLAALRSLSRQELVKGCEIAIYLVDDGSRDGTAAAVQHEFPAVELMLGDGSLFWNGGMRKAFAEAMRKEHDAYLWFNDDTVLKDDALRQLVQCSQDWQREHGPAIVVGSVCDRESSKHTYGGFRMKRHGFSMELEALLPDPIRLVACDSMNGNFVLIPSEIAVALGNLESRFRHQIGDVDYGLRARAAGFDVLLAPGYLGYCCSNSSDGTWRDRSIPFRQRWQNLMSPKGAPIAEWLLYTRRHYGWRWPLYAMSPYLKTIVTSLLPNGR